jgi:hypothetical protein
MELYTFDEAAKVIGCSKRSVHNYIKKGFITRVFDTTDNTPKVKKDEVILFTGESSTTYPGISKRSFMELSRRVQRAEETLAVMKVILGIGERPIRCNEVQAAGFTNACLLNLNNTSWTPEEMDFWANQILLFDEITLGSIAKVGLETAPWVPYFKLISAMYEKSLVDFDTKPSITTEKLKVKLEKTKKHLYSMGLIWTELNKDSSEYLMRLQTKESKKVK